MNQVPSSHQESSLHFIKDKVFIVTGTRKGIGKALSEYYLSRGGIVCGCARKHASITHNNYRHFCVDVHNEKAVTAMVRSVKKEFGQIDILLNNAGIASMNHILTTPYKTMQDIFATNVFGSFLFLREVAKSMSQSYKKISRDSTMRNAEVWQMPFRIVNFATIATALRLEGEAAYSASKAAIINLTQICAKELSSFGITVNAIAPTPVSTDLIKNVPIEKLNALVASQAIKRFGQIADIANSIDFFIHPRSDFITGQILYLGGVNA
ncbi:SDR family NAD(P)-dependent oxidoreductase [Helicobacter aurati]|uniref:SDR family NAD(P)-dependent oxidoreductase n=1 Tax=Helicobacter aurati TaxID=137778 RepID=A0A3D8J871_9HELI|nr:SDR family oxidoreductase [Helicobacter aurati]RDU73622.1 SDR family NAD(P)-dependent oxidoreductase [Helicobacter aurati]